MLLEAKVETSHPTLRSRDLAGTMPLLQVRKLTVSIRARARWAAGKESGQGTLRRRASARRRMGVAYRFSKLIDP